MDEIVNKWLNLKKAVKLAIDSSKHGFGCKAIDYDDPGACGCWKVTVDVVVKDFESALIKLLREAETGER